MIRVDSIGQLLDTASLLSAQPPPRGNEVAIVTNGGGPGILCADSCHAASLDVVEFPSEVRETLASFLPEGESVGNPVDMIATASPETYRKTIETLVKADVCDAIIAPFVPPLRASAEDVTREIHAAGQHANGVTLCSVFMDRDAPGHTGTAGEVHVPRFTFPEDAVRALADAARYSQWRARPTGKVREPGGDRPDEAAAIIARSLAAGPGRCSGSSSTRASGR